jgi:two-component sensor histidine kinase
MQMSSSSSDRTVEKLLRQQSALASFGKFALREPDLMKILTEAARLCAASLGVPFCKVCRYREMENDLLIVAGCGWDEGVVGLVISQANESSPQGRAYVTGEPVIIRNIRQANNLALPAFYPHHGIVSTVDVLIPTVEGAPYGVLEIDSPIEHQYDEHDIIFLTGFANVLAEAVATANRVQALKALLAQRNLLAEELQHRVRNTLQMVSSMLAGYSRTASDPSTREEMNTTARLVMTLAQIYDSLLGVGLSSTIDLADYLRAFCNSLPGLHEVQSQKIDLICNAESVPLPLESVTALGMVVAELVANSYGHAFPDRGGVINVKLSRSNSGRDAMLAISDDGVGFVVKSETPQRGLGLVKRLVQQVNGTLNVHSGEGTLWTLAFAVPAPAG